MSAKVEGQFESTAMNAMSDVATMNRLSKSLEDVEAYRLGINAKEARKRSHHAGDDGIQNEQKQKQRLQAEEEKSGELKRLTNSFERVKTNELRRHSRSKR